LVCPSDNPDDLSSRASIVATSILFGDLNHHRVTMHGCAAIFGWHEQVLEVTGPFGNHEPDVTSSHIESPYDQVGVFRKAQSPFLFLNEQPFEKEFIESFVKRFELVCLYAESFRQSIGLLRYVSTALYRFQNVVSSERWHGGLMSIE
jgi:hypothetical protein